MVDKKKNQGPEDPGRRDALRKLGIAGLSLASLLSGANAVADDTRKATIRDRYSKVLDTSRVAQELDRTPEIIGQKEMDRLVASQDLIAAHFINPLFIDLIEGKKFDADDKESWYQKALDALYKALQHPYDLYYEEDPETGDYIIKKRVIGANNGISDGFQIRIDMSRGRVGCITSITDEVEYKGKNQVKTMPVIKSSSAPKTFMNPQKIADIVAQHKAVINAELGDQSEDSKRALPEPLKRWFMLLNKTIPRNIALVMEARGFHENRRANLAWGSYADLARFEQAQRRTLHSYQDYVDNDDNWQLEVFSLREQPGFYRILLMGEEYDADNNIDISLDGYVLEADENTGDVIKNTRGDTHPWQLDEMYYKDDPDGKPEHLLRSNYYRQHGGARDVE